MKTHWLKGYNKDKAKREAEVMAYKNAFDELTLVINQNYLKKEAVRDYSSPNWEIQQIAVNEYNAVLNDILNLIDLTED
jgi:uncharacterized membrane protein